MNADLILDAFEKIDDKYIIEAKEGRFMNNSSGKKIRSLKAHLYTCCCHCCIAGTLWLCCV